VRCRTIVTPRRRPARFVEEANSSIARLRSPEGRPLEFARRRAAGGPKRRPGAGERGAPRNFMGPQIRLTQLRPRLDEALIGDPAVIRRSNFGADSSARVARVVRLRTKSWARPADGVVCAGIAAFNFAGLTVFRSLIGTACRHSDCDHSRKESPESAILATETWR
jgi:hypothetical protein